MQKHKDKLYNWLQRLYEEKLAVSLDNNKFSQTEIIWIGNEINQKAIKTLVNETKAIRGLESPSTIKQLKLFIGSVHHLTKFISRLATQSRTFHELLKKDKEYMWIQTHHAVSDQTKEHMKHIRENTHYNPT